MIRRENKYLSQILKPYISNLHFYITRNDSDSNFETMAEISPDCKTKKLQEFYRKCRKFKHQENFEDLLVAYSSDDVG